METTQSDAHGDERSADTTDAVRCSFWCDGVADQFVLHAFRVTEELDAPYLIELEVAAELEVADPFELLGRDAHLSLERSSQLRSFCGVVSRVVLRDEAEARQHATIEVRPALAALALTRSTRIFQDKTAIEILGEVLGAGLAAYGRTHDASRLDASLYPRRDYCVQYAETDLDFVHRLLEEEGIGYFFEPGEPCETLVLFDAPGMLARADTMDGGPVRYDHASRTFSDAEPIRRFEMARRLSPTKVTVRDHDWTRGRPTVERTADTKSAELSARERAHELYEHGHGRSLAISEDNELLTSMVGLAMRAVVPAVMPSGWDVIVRNLPGLIPEPFTSDDSPHQSQVRRERARRDFAMATGASLVCGFAVGRTFELAGHPTSGADGEYYLTRVVHTGHASGGQYENEFACRRTSVAWRPERRTRKPRIYGAQTATVTGPIGTDVHTDPHGRIKVRFPWDRRAPDPAGNHTCWIRTSQAWAGQGMPGFLFIPRVGMEVVVTFLDGDPDRPLVTGCVYNGQSPTPALLPFQATKSIIRTRTIPHGPGYSELSFEDAVGARPSTCARSATSTRSCCTITSRA